MSPALVWSVTSVLIVAGAALEALFAGRGARDALKAGLGAGLGVIAGTAGRLALALAMAAWLVADFLIC